MHRRRTYLSLLGTATAIGFAGCAATGDGESLRDPSDSTETGTGSTADEGTELTVEAGAVGTPDLDWTIEKLADATDEQPCTLRITIENTGSARELTAAGRVPFPPTPGNPIEGDGDVERPVLVPVAADYEPQYGGNCWQAAVDDPEVADDAPWDWGHGDERTRLLEPGEQVEGTYSVVAEWTQYCFQRGEYRFDRRYTVNGTSYQWTFTLTVPTYDRDA